MRQVDTSTPTGKMVFTVLGAVAELERSLIAERVRAGLRNARAKGKRLGRPKVDVDAARIARLRASGHSWNAITSQLGIGRGTGLPRPSEPSQKGLLDQVSAKCLLREVHPVQQGSEAGGGAQP